MSAFSSPSAIEKQAIETRRQFLVSMLGRVQEDVSEDEGRSLAVLFHNESRPQELRHYFTHAMTIPKFRAWYAASQSTTLVEALRDAVREDVDDGAIRRALDDVVKVVGVDDAAELRRSHAVVAVRDKKAIAWRALTAEPFDVTVDDAEYLRIAVSPQVPKEIWEHGINSLRDAVLGRRLVVRTAADIIRRCHEDINALPKIDRPAFLLQGACNGALLALVQFMDDERSSSSSSSSRSSSPSSSSPSSSSSAATSSKKRKGVQKGQSTEVKQLCDACERLLIYDSKARITLVEVVEMIEKEDAGVLAHTIRHNIAVGKALKHVFGHYEDYVNQERIRANHFYRLKAKK